MSALELELYPNEIQEDPSYLTDQLITYLGNKRSLVSQLNRCFIRVQNALNGRPIRAVDLFSGSGVVSRVLKQYASYVLANDQEPYAETISKCYLANHADIPWKRVNSAVDRLNQEADGGKCVDGFIQHLYSPEDDNHIQKGERAFYTSDNARRIDYFASEIRKLEPELRPYLLGPLLSEASVHANTSGVFKGFYKDKVTGVGKFGGSGQNALSRILKPIRLSSPVTSRFSCDIQVTRKDANKLAHELETVDLVYIDPPYNQHPYGSNYFMLNLIVNYEPPAQISAVSGIPTDWNRSGYNKKREALTLMRDLVATLSSRFVAISFNSEGFIPISDFHHLLGEFGRYEDITIPYNTFRGSRNLRSRDIHVDEHLFLLERRNSKKGES
ncbi:MAG: DNA adenine methylase [Microbacteriaceae bacterium]|jgi:adenine-specific DNA-methyltransferase|nr:DNA adenine methylase [Microbacteriaceae bacterium]